MCYPQFSVCNAIQAFIFYSLSTRIGFVALILLVLWAQNTLNMEDWLLSKFKRLWQTISRENYENNMCFSSREYKHIQGQLFTKGGRNIGNIDGILCWTVLCHFPLPVASPSSDASRYLDSWYSDRQRGKSAVSGAEWERGHVRKWSGGKKVWRENYSTKEKGHHTARPRSHVSVPRR